MNNKSITITHRRTGVVLAQGPIGWGITSFEGNYYISRPHLKDGLFKANFVPGLCPYKFLYVWMDLLLPDGSTEKSLGWMYWLPNPFSPSFGFALLYLVIIQASASSAAQVTIRTARLGIAPGSRAARKL